MWLTQPTLAHFVGPIVFVVVVVGGLGSLAGALIASMFIGILQTFAVAVDSSLLDLFRALGIAVDRSVAVLRALFDQGRDRGAHRPLSVAGADADRAAAGPPRYARRMKNGTTLAAPPLAVAEARAKARGRLQGLGRDRGNPCAPAARAGPPLGLRPLDAEPDGNRGRVRAVVQHAAGADGPPVLRSCGVLRPRRLRRHPSHARHQPWPADPDAVRAARRRGGGAPVRHPVRVGVDAPRRARSSR